MNNASNGKKIVRDMLLSGVKPAKKLAARHPKLKRVIRNFVLETVNIHSNHFEVDEYKRWVERHYPDAIALNEMGSLAAAFSYRPKISILVPTYNTNIEHLYECIASVQAQIYDNWELCIVDDNSQDGGKVRDKLTALAAADKRIKIKFQTKNGHISKATNAALKLATGTFIGLLDHDDILWPNALFEVVKALNGDHAIDFLYSDEDKIEYSRHDHQNPFFKPDWNPEFLESVNYITHFAVLKKELVDAVGGFRSQYDGAQDWDLFLRAAYQARRVYHIPTILYSWRISDMSTASNTDAKPYVVSAQKGALEASLKQRGHSDAKVVRSGLAKDYWTVVYPTPVNAKVSIVIPTKNQLAVVKRCVNSIYQKTTYMAFEIILVDTGSTDKAVHNWYKGLQRDHSNLTVLNWPEQPFSYARACNHGAAAATGEYLVMLNNDTEVLTPNWLELLLGDAQRDDVGPVGCKLFYPDGRRIQHAGIGIGLGGIAANLLSLVPKNQMGPLQFLYANTRHEVTAVTAACLMIRRDRFDAISGFDEAFRVTYNDVDLCLRLGKAGFRSVYNPAVELLHHESISVGLPTELKKRDTTEFDTARKLFLKRWKSVIDHDPQLNPNFSRTNALFTIKTK